MNPLTTRQEYPTGAPALLDGADDPVLLALARAEDSYRAARASWDLEAADLRRQRDELADAADAGRAAAAEVQKLRGQVERQRERAERARRRAEQLAAALKDIHRALIGGNVFELILRACLTLTGATRGVYLIARGERLTPRAAIDVDGYPGKAPSAFLRGLCDRALEGNESFVANRPEELAGLPVPEGPGEAFQNCLAAPAVLLKHYHGVVVLADKPGEFDREDVELVLSIGDQAGVALENQRLQAELLRSYFSIVGVLADAIEAKDPYTHGHCEQVARLARRTAQRLGVSEQLRSVCCYGGLLHDIGKIGVSDGVLNKPGKLQPEEWDLMKAHVRIGRDLLAHVPALDGVSEVVLHHHERYDGAGYPDGLAGEGIPLAARIVGVVDAYCAMTSKRSYKESSSPEEARQELIRCRGSHFDPAVVDALLVVLDEPDEEEPLPDLPEQDFPHALRRLEAGA